MEMMATYEEITEACQQIAKQVQSDDWPPEVIVGVSRGGLIPATILAHQLEIPRVCAVDVGFANPHSRTFPTLYSRPDLVGHPDVLLVEDAVDTARLLTFAREVVKSYAGLAYTASLFRRPSSPTVNYVAYTVDELPRMPWER